MDLIGLPALLFSPGKWGAVTSRNFDYLFETAN